MKNKNELLRSLPKVDECLLRLSSYISKNDIPAKIAKKAVQAEIDQVRQQILDDSVSRIPQSVEEWTAYFKRAIETLQTPNFRRVINGTGVVVHTNLGRSLLSENAVKQLVEASKHYTNLELDLGTGKRGSRYALVEEIICDLTGAEAAMVVNNNAAAVMIALDTLANGKEVIVSRGQLVEIGGSFRIPDVMAKSGACLVEVGATNRTHLYDYENALTEYTSLLLRVHTSNFRVIGFTSEVSAAELVELGRKHGIAVMEDLGSGSFLNMSLFGLPGEPTVQDVVSAGVDVVTFSGDKLLGGPQAGLIVGRKEFIDKIKKNPLNRALRIDKFTLASLEATLRSYYNIDTALSEVPTLRLIGESQASIKRRGQKILRAMKKQVGEQDYVQLVQTKSRVGGGALPEYSLDSWAIELMISDLEAYEVERHFRSLPVPIIGRIENDRFLLDCRTMDDKDIPHLCSAMTSISSHTD